MSHTTVFILDSMVLTATKGTSKWKVGCAVVRNRTNVILNRENSTDTDNYEKSTLVINVLIIYFYERILNNSI